MDPFVLKNLNKARQARQAAIVITHLGDGRDRMVLEADNVEGELGEAVRKTFASGKSAKLEISGHPYFLNVHLPSPRLVIIGAVHISQALAPMAAIAGFEVSIIDPRTAFATQERFGEFNLFPEWPQEVLPEAPLDAFTALAAVTHDPKIDDFPLAAALNADCFYIGALGSRKTHAKRLERLKELGIPAEKLDEIKAPIGLDIKATSPQEIAVAILAEIIGELRNRGIEHK
ncbi:MAG: XdhC family protein [Pseudomonadota bacterium]